MAQKGMKAAKKTKSSGAKRKVIGFTKKHKHTSNQGRNAIRDQATSQYINFVERTMASRLPSDQRDKLSIVKPEGPKEDKKGKRKPLTRGRKRK
jgi:hypothetical protein